MGGKYFADYLSVLELREWKDGTYRCPPLLRFGQDGILIKEALKIPEPLWEAFNSAKEPGIPLPPNLIVAGTVNMDETTHTFSRKVLDRAFTLEFDRVDYGLFRGDAVQEESGPLDPQSILCPYTDASDAGIPEGVREPVLSLLEKWNVLMDGTPFRVAYRTANESLLFAAFRGEQELQKSLDEILMMKLLPWLEGDAPKLAAAAVEAEDEPGSLLEALDVALSQIFGESWAGTKSRKKLRYMISRLKTSGYTSFWP